MASTPMNAGLPVRPPPGALLRRTVITNGAGTFVPLFPGVRARVVAQGAGAGGAGISSATYSAPSGDMIDAWVRLAGPTAFAVGAGGPGATGSNVPTNGGDTVFGLLVARGGLGVLNNRSAWDAERAVRLAGGWVTQGASSAGQLTPAPGASSMFGTGGATTAPGNATGYGAGGGNVPGGTGGSGSGGLLIIEEYAD